MCPMCYYNLYNTSWYTFDDYNVNFDYQINLSGVQQALLCDY